MWEGKRVRQDVFLREAMVNKKDFMAVEVELSCGVGTKERNGSRSGRMAEKPLSVFKKEAVRIKVVS